MWKDKQLFSHRTPWAVRPYRHVPLAVSCRHQGLECRTQGFSMGERNHFERLWTSVTLAGRDGSREIAYSLESRHARYSSFRPVRGSGEPPPSHHQGCSNPSSYLPSLSFRWCFCHPVHQIVSYSLAPGVAVSQSTAPATQSHRTTLAV